MDTHGKPLFYKWQYFSQSSFLDQLGLIQWQINYRACWCHFKWRFLAVSVPFCITPLYVIIMSTNDKIVSYTCSLNDNQSNKWRWNTFLVVWTIVPETKTVPQNSTRSSLEVRSTLWHIQSRCKKAFPRSPNRKIKHSFTGIFRERCVSCSL